MDKIKFIVLLICIALTMIYFNRLNCIEEKNVICLLGQADLETAGDIFKRKIHSDVNKKYMHSRSINIIEKYFTIYIILYILSYYIKSSWIMT